MGFKHFSGSSYDPTPNPDPRNFKIMYWYRYKDCMVVEARYPTCTNYEGVKIIVYKGVTKGDILGADILDPHFSSSKDRPCPIARFEPTKIGMELAKHMARLIGE